MPNSGVSSSTVGSTFHAVAVRAFFRVTKPFLPFLCPWASSENRPLKWNRVKRVGREETKLLRGYHVEWAIHMDNEVDQHDGKKWNGEDSGHLPKASVDVQKKPQSVNNEHNHRAARYSSNMSLRALRVLHSWREVGEQLWEARRRLIHPCPVLPPDPMMPGPWKNEKLPLKRHTGQPSLFPHLLSHPSLLGDLPKYIGIIILALKKRFSYRSMRGHVQRCSR